MLHSTINDLEQYSLRECVEIKGIASDESENTEDIVLKIAKNMGLVLKKSDIGTSHRIHHYNEGKRNNDGSCNQNTSDEEKNLNTLPKITVTFISIHVYASFMENRYKIKFKEIFVNTVSNSLIEKFLANACSTKRKNSSSIFGPKIAKPK